MRLLRLALLLISSLGAAMSLADDKSVAPAKRETRNGGGRRWAFLVGINDYVSQPRLKYSRQDCLSLRTALVELARFDARQMVILTDGAPEQRDWPTFGNNYGRLPQLLELVEPGDLVVVYFSGHGAQFEDPKGKHAYFIPLDGGNRQTSIPLLWLSEQLEACKASQKVLILDACRNDVIDGGRATRSLEDSVVSEAHGRSFVTMLACDAGQKSSEHDQAPNGVYTHYLLEGMAGAADRDQDGKVDVFELHQYARDHTQRWGLQHAQPQSPVLRGEIGETIDLASRIRAPSPQAQPGPDMPRILTLDLDGGVKMELVRINAGSFQMGSEDGARDEKPVHTVRFTKPFYLGKYEVTQEQWRQVMGTAPSFFKGVDLPVEQVSWEDCQSFCQRLSQRTGRTTRLPTEAEWEYACRAGSSSKYCYGDSEDELDQYACYLKNSDSKTLRVGSKRANAWDLHDMHGNVWEWCEDWKHDDYSGAPTDGSAWLSGGKHTDRVLRGGAWYYFPGRCRSAFRYWLTPDVQYFYCGFRVVVSAGTP